MSTLAVAENEVARQQWFLRSLNFERRQSRYSSLPEAHKKTFTWVFNSSKPEYSVCRLADWLESGSGIFWISGKPGSGKSTFMKFLADSPKTKELLQSWSGHQSAVIVAHYFWNVGTLEQKSYDGLLRTLLWEIFCQCPDLIESSCPSRWALTKIDCFAAEWTIKEMAQVLRIIAEIDDTEFKFCFLIDGLDEYNGDRMEFCQILAELSLSPHYKFCVASRPWNVFEHQYGHSPSKIYIHELTRDDIRAYTEHRLFEHPRWRELKQMARFDCDYLVKEITDKSLGVFLWVYLVTRSLRSGLAEFDTFFDLCRRVKAFPSDLESFFTHILDSVDPFYHIQMATTLQIALAADWPLDTWVYGFHDKEYEDIDYALHLPLRTFGIQESQETHIQMRHRLNARCRGLLQVEKYSQKVGFLHRTVKDFLKTATMPTYLTARSYKGFHPSLSHLKAQVAWIKTRHYAPRIITAPRFSLGDFRADVEEALSYATATMRTTGFESQSLELVNELARRSYEMQITSILSPELVRHHLQGLLQRFWGTTTGGAPSETCPILRFDELQGFQPQGIPTGRDQEGLHKRKAVEDLQEPNSEQKRSRLDVWPCCVRDYHLL